MTLLGVPTAGGGFSIGSNVVAGNTNEPKSSMNMSLDEVIENRRKDAVKESRRGGGGRGTTRVSTGDRAIGSGRAKRQAAVNARRQMTATKKPTKMEVDQEVKKQASRTQKTKDRQEQRKVGGRAADAGGAGRRARVDKKQQAAPLKETKIKGASVFAPSRAPSKKAVKAAVDAFQANGFKIPEGTQMVIRFEQPAGGGASNNNTTAARGGRGGAGAAANKSGGRGQGSTRGRNSNAGNNNSNNNNTNRNTNNTNNNNNTRRSGRGRK